MVATILSLLASVMVMPIRPGNSEAKSFWKCSAPDIEISCSPSRSGRKRHQERTLRCRRFGPQGVPQVRRQPQGLTRCRQQHHHDLGGKEQGVAAADALIEGQGGGGHNLEIGRATSELQSLRHLVCRLLLEKKKE